MSPPAVCRNCVAPFQRGRVVLFSGTGGIPLPASFLGSFPDPGTEEGHASASIHSFVVVISASPLTFTVTNIRSPRSSAEGREPGHVHRGPELVATSMSLHNTRHDSSVADWRGWSGTRLGRSAVTVLRRPNSLLSRGRQPKGLPLFPPSEFCRRPSSSSSRSLRAFPSFSWALLSASRIFGTSRAQGRHIFSFRPPARHRHRCRPPPPRWGTTAKDMTEATMLDPPALPSFQMPFEGRERATTMTEMAPRCTVVGRVNRRLLEGAWIRGKRERI